ncbi:MAG: hypothetical protein AAF483_04780 [Planctomycetota bacterium]
MNDITTCSNLPRTPDLTACICNTILCLLLIGLGERAQAQELAWQLDLGQRSIELKPPSIASQLRNQWPDDLESEFQTRAKRIIKRQRENQKAGVNTYFENEKRSYGFLMAHILGGNVAEGLKKLQVQDHQHEQWHKETAGIDYFACFTLKHQIRKYFFFGPALDPKYKQQMYEGAKKWTVKDPLKRPHYAFDDSTGWGPNAKNSWVDVRSTENLYLMRVTSVYLMAEETGNRETTQLYKQEILNYAKTLLHIGIGEWDSENYHGHSIAPLLNLYDFAKDEQIKVAAKACLDFFAAAGAVKYWRGGFNGPTKRDYNHAQPFGGSAANSLWVWFGDHPRGKSDHWESDEVHQITSAYRPPLAVVNLARKRFDKPIEIFSAKPEYSATTSHRINDAEYLETQYIAHSYQMGSLTCGTSVDGGDVCGFKILVWDEDEGAVTIQAAPTANPKYPGSPMYKKDIVSAQNRVAQQENIALWLTKDGRSAWTWVFPQSVQTEHVQGVTFLKSDKTWIAIRGLGTSDVIRDRTKTATINDSKKPKFPGHQAFSAVGTNRNFCGMAVEIGEKESHGSFEQFRADVLAAEVDPSELEKGIVRYKAKDGKHLGIHWNDDPMNLGVWRSGKHRNLQDAKRQLYDSSVIRSTWDSGTLEINAGGESFTVAESNFLK